MNDEDCRTIWCGNLSEKVNEELLYELFLQAGPLQRVSIPRTKEGKPRSFGFVTYRHECSVVYAMDLFRGTELFRRELNLKTRNPSCGQLNSPGAPERDMRNNRFGLEPGHYRSQSAPTKIQSEQNGKPDFESLMLLGQQMMSVPNTLTLGPGALYGSQMGGSNYLGGSSKVGDNSLVARSLQGGWSSRNHPYNRNNSGNNSGYKRHDSNRDHRRRR